MRNILLVILLLSIMMLIGELHGFKRGYEHGRKDTNSWWIDQKSRIYDTSELLKNDTVKGYDRI